jgi:hypothetical protein
LANLFQIYLNVDNEDADPDCTIQQMMGELNLSKIPHFFVCHDGKMVASIQTSNGHTLESFLDDNLPQ